MGMYLNPGKTAFEEAVNSEIFVDKTQMIRVLNTIVKTKQKYVSVSRPRRFGKTMAADMICAYYGIGADSRDMFSDKKLSKTDSVQGAGKKIPWDGYLGAFDVIRIVMTDFLYDSKDAQDMLSYLTEEVTGELCKTYPKIDYGSRHNLHSVMSRIYDDTGRQFVVVLDEWDAIFRVWKGDEKGQTRYLDFLRDWLKDKPYIALAYITGILPIKKYGEHSALNMFTEYSMTFPRQLAPFTGFTKEEVRELCSRYGRDYAAVSDWYDGYIVSDVVPPDPGHEELIETGASPVACKYALYSPLSVVESMRTGRIQNYWNKTETYEALADYIRRDYDGLKDAVALLMDGGRLKVDTSTYQNDMTTFSGRDDILSLLIHLGYLGFDDDRSEVFIPNKEILDEFRTSTKSSEWVDTFKSFRTQIQQDGRYGISADPKTEISGQAGTL